ncbi:hypothetical protein [Paenibacillus sp. GYB003]|uniref:hypothetical protein n=1 Tax=Paenibacillus sp. GYB003 TaxID=2994392 RepID=UPI002F96C22E
MCYVGYRIVQTEFEYYYHPGVELSDEKAIWNFIMDNKKKYAIIKITVKGENVVSVEAVNGRVVFPLLWSIMELSTDYEDSPDEFTPLGFIEELRIRRLDRQLIEVPFTVNQALEQLKRIYATLQSEPNSHVFK